MIFPGDVLFQILQGESHLVHIPILDSRSSRDERISKDGLYLAHIYGHWYLGGFSEQWYGWSFNDWGTSGIQLNHIEDLYEIHEEKGK